MDLLYSRTRRLRRHLSQLRRHAAHPRGHPGSTGRGPPTPAHGCGAGHLQHIARRL